MGTLIFMWLSDHKDNNENQRRTQERVHIISIERAPGGSVCEAICLWLRS